MNCGVSLHELANSFGEIAMASYADGIADLIAAGLLTRENDAVRLTSRGRLLSNEVFERFISVDSTL
ncbi:MAG: hypothetical protein DMG97_10330 [Acidobacteria bacterium]|nr:MAG: hypothetical protein DMG97_10330 [Acidobacteriota bacterium]